MADHKPSSPTDNFIPSYTTEQHLPSPVQELHQQSPLPSSQLQQEELFQSAMSEELGSEEQPSPSSNSQEAKTYKSKENEESGGEDSRGEGEEHREKDASRQRETINVERIESKGQDKQDKQTQQHNLGTVQKYQSMEKGRSESQQFGHTSELLRHNENSQSVSKSLQMVRTIDLHTTITSPVPVPPPSSPQRPSSGLEAPQFLDRMQSRSSTKTQILGEPILHPTFQSSKKKDSQTMQHHKMSLQPSIVEKKIEPKAYPSKPAQRQHNPYHVGRATQHGRLNYSPHVKQHCQLIAEEQSEQPIESEQLEAEEPQMGSPQPQEAFHQLMGLEPREHSNDSLQQAQSARPSSEMRRSFKIHELQERLRLQEESINELSGEMALHHRSLMSCLAGVAVGGVSWVMRRNPTLSVLLGTATTAAFLLLGK